MGITVGIDLGTSNSAIAVHKLNSRVLCNQEGETSTPSCVTILPNGAEASYVVGRAARDLLKQYPTNTILSVKRLMGREIQEPEVLAMTAQSRMGYRVETDSSEPGSIRIAVGDFRFTPENISAQILTKVIRDAEQELGESISHAVVTVPAYFADRQKFATRSACEQAGIKLLRLLPEPTAAAISYGVHELDKESCKTIMVFDLGGGTFDVSILSVAGGQYMEVTKGGDMWLGGDDIDKLMSTFVFAEFERLNPELKLAELVNTLEDVAKARFQIELLAACEKAKIELSSQSEAQIEIFGDLKGLNGKFIPIDISITQSQFKELLDPILVKLVAITKNILDDVRFESDLIDMVLMVGGSSLIPAVQEALRKEFGESKVVVHPRPMLAVVEGAAAMAQSLVSQDTNDKFHLMHSTAHDYYLQLANGKRHLLVARNTPLPVSVEENFIFAQEGQEMARLRILNEIDGVLETAGEMWIFRVDKDPLDFDIIDTCKGKTELSLKLDIDENNIIQIATGLKGKKGDYKAHVLGRGGAVTWLFEELERSMSKCFAMNTDEAKKLNLINFARILVHNILQISNPNTGETNSSLKIKVLEQISNLIKIHAESGDIFISYFYNEAFRTMASNALPKEEQKIFTANMQSLSQALLEVNSSQIAELQTVVDKQLTDFNCLEFVNRAAFVKQISIINSSDGRKLEAELSNLVSAKQKNNASLIRFYEEQFDDLASKYSSSPGSKKQQSFDRDIVLQSR